MLRPVSLSHRARTPVPIVAHKMMSLSHLTISYLFIISEFFYRTNGHNLVARSFLSLLHKKRHVQ